MKASENRSTKDNIFTEFIAYTELGRFLAWYYLSSALESLSFEVKTTLKMWKVFCYKYGWVMSQRQYNSTLKLRFSKAKDKN